MNQAAREDRGLALLARACTALAAMLFVACVSTRRELPALGKEHPASPEAPEGVVTDLRSTFAISEEPSQPSGPAEAAHEHGHEMHEPEPEPSAEEPHDAAGVKPEEEGGQAEEPAEARAPAEAHHEHEEEPSEPLPEPGKPGAEHHEHVPEEHHDEQPPEAPGPEGPHSHAAEETHEEAARSAEVPESASPHATPASSSPEGWRLWEIHPRLVAFPIAFVIGGMVLELFALVRRRETLGRVATGLLLGGVSTGLLAGSAGLLAYFTVPAHTEQAHELMGWHGGLLALALLVLLVALLLRRGRPRPPPVSTALALLSTVLLAAGAYLGGKLVFRDAAGVSPELLAPEIRAGHHHHGGEEAPASEPAEDMHDHRHTAVDAQAHAH